MHIRKKQLAWAFAVLTVIVVGCGQPQAGRENLQLLASLRTALSAENVEWLDQNVEIIEQRRQEGAMSEQTHARLLAIVEKARAGQWRDAEQDLVAFQKAQRPQT